MNLICSKSLERLKKSVNSTKNPIIQIEFHLEDDGSVIPEIYPFDIIQSKSKLEDGILISAFRLKAKIMHGYPGEKNEYLSPHKLEDAYFISEVFDKNPQYINQVKIKSVKNNIIFSDFYSFKFKPYKGHYYFKFQHTKNTEVVKHLKEIKDNPYMHIEI